MKPLFIRYSFIQDSASSTRVPHEENNKIFARKIQFCRLAGEPIPRSSTLTILGPARRSSDPTVTCQSAVIANIEVMRLFYRNFCRRSVYLYFVVHSERLWSYQYGMNGGLVYKLLFYRYFHLYHI